MRRDVARLAALGLVLVAAVMAGCGSGDDSATTPQAPRAGSAPIRIGSKNFGEQTILGQLYGRALEAKGYDVELKPDLGSTEIIHRALRRGALDMYPEYIGVLLSEVAHVRERPRSSTAAYAVARRYEHQGGFTLLAQTPFADANALAVKPSFARRHRLRTIADLRRLKGTVKIAALAEFATRFEGIHGLHEVYGLRHVAVVPVKGLARYTALERGRSQVASVFTTETELGGHDYVVLADPRRVFASGHVAPIISDKVLAAHGAGVATTIDAVTRLLTTRAMREMNSAVVDDKRSPSAVASEFLRAHGML